MHGEPLLVMLVEDNLDHAELVKRNLSEHRVVNRLIHVTDGQEALDYLFHREPYTDVMQNPRPHVILLDLRLPKVDGLEVLRIIKESDELCVIPVVILTTSEAEKDVASAYTYRANSYLVKPVGFAEFQYLMETLGFYWLGWNTYPHVPLRG